MNKCETCKHYSPAIQMVPYNSLTSGGCNKGKERFELEYPDKGDLLYAARLILGATNSNSSCTLHEQKDGEK